ncbi:hypothetical protein [Prauserella flavalba]|uniref:hypothetical protein n=1 Tax=Prauserella flavalba TaxID=1477506 RepID=UPI0036E49387
MASTPTSTGAPVRASRGDPHPPNAQPATDPGGPHTDTARSSRGRPFATVWVCPVDPPFRINDVVAAAIRTFVTSYTQPGDRVLLAIPSRPGPRHRQDRLVEMVLRLGRGATIPPTPHPQDDHSTTEAGLCRPPESEAGPGPTDPDATVSIAAETITGVDRARPPKDRFALIITTQPARHEDADSIIDWADHLTDSGTLIAVTHSGQHGSLSTAASPSVVRSAALAGLALTDRLVLLHQEPTATSPATDRDRRRLALGAHRRIHTDALVFTTSRPGGAA